ncbi:MAG: heme-degrading domain-containing protein [Acidimicrobiales bacterium]|jgi:uncharacterized protein (UPF0303 family)
MTDDDSLTTLLLEEERLVFSSFDHETAWLLGSQIRQSALEAALPIAIDIRLHGQRLFHAALAGSSANNDLWLERKCAVVDLFAHSSYYVGALARAEGNDDFNVTHRLDPARYAAHGGAFPILLRGTGCVGAVAVSGLPQVEDHRFVVAQLEKFLAR